MTRTRNMDLYRDIIHRLRNKQSVRAIHRDIGVHRTVIRKLKTIGKEKDWLNPSLPMPDNQQIQNAFEEPFKKKSPSKSYLQPFFEQIKEWHLSGCPPIVIHQLLKERCNTSQRSVQRFIQQHFPKPLEPVMLREFIPGETADIDYGYLGIVYDYATKRNRKAWIFSMRLRFSRKAYRQLCFDQSSKSFLMAHVHAFEFFGAIPQKIVLDNLKAGVIQACRVEPLLNKSYISLAEHYGFLISPCAPRTPEHKGGVENDIKYIKNNFWPLFCAHQREKGRIIPLAEELAQALSLWEKEIADKRKIAGIGNTPEELFAQEIEQMKPLPMERWDPIEWAETVVQRDWRIRYDNVYYSVPAQLIGQKVMICAGNSIVKIFHNHIEAAVHSRSYVKGSFQRKSEHAPACLERVLKANRESLEILAEKKGGAIEEVVKNLLCNPIHDRLNAARSIFELEKKVGQMRLEAACQRALHFGEANYLNVKRILEKGLDSVENSETIAPSNYRHYEFCRTQDQYKI